MTFSISHSREVSECGLEDKTKTGRTVFRWGCGGRWQGLLLGGKEKRTMIMKKTDHKNSNRKYKWMGSRAL